MSAPDAAVEIKAPNKHVEAAIPVILGRGFNSLRLHWFQSEPNPQVTYTALLAVFFVSRGATGEPAARAVVGGRRATDRGPKGRTGRSTPAVCEVAGGRRGDPAAIGDAGADTEAVLKDWT